jgi:hypothetical protein
MVAFAAERANVDLMLFVMIVAAGGLASGGLGRRLLSYGLVFFAGLLKFYPLVALMIALRERLAILAGVAATSVVTLALFTYGYRHELAAIGHAIPGAGFAANAFAARYLADGLSTLSPSKTAALAAFALVAVCAGAVVVSLCRDGEWARAFAAMERREQTLLVMAGAIIVGCFFAGQSANYRAIFLIPVVGGLLAMRRVSDLAGLRARLGWLVGIILALMWGDAFRSAIRSASPPLQLLVWCARELAWWWAVASLLAVLVVFAVQSQALADLRDLVARPRRE